MKLNLFILFMLLFALTGPAAAQISDDLLTGCDKCHGVGGVSNRNDVPTIAGQPAAYLSASLRNYRQWERPCVKTGYGSGSSGTDKTDMCQIAEALTVDEIGALGDHYAALPFVPAKQPFDAAQAELGGDLHEIHCETCHAMGGTIAARGPILAGQWAAYLRNAIAQALSGEHLVPPVMENRLTDFSAGDIDALVNFYASRQ